MKKNRNCGGSTLYPTYSQAMPMINMQPQMFPQQAMNPVMMPGYGQINHGYNNIEQQINNIEQQINSLENRVSKLESKTSTSSYTNKYNDSNYYML